jgi:hypothetical protein
MMHSPKLTASFVLLAALFARLPLVSACAVCLTGANGSGAEAYDWSVLFLMATPYLVTGSIAAYIVCAYRRAAARKEHKAALDGASFSLEPEESQR